MGWAGPPVGGAALTFWGSYSISLCHLQTQAVI